MEAIQVAATCAIEGDDWAEGILPFIAQVVGFAG